MLIGLRTDSSGHSAECRNSVASPGSVLVSYLAVLAFAGGAGHDLMI
jgi:hypothetical protein